MKLATIDKAMTIGPYISNKAKVIVPKKAITAYSK
jgi:hypothetical protein